MQSSGCTHPTDASFPPQYHVTQLHPFQYTLGHREAGRQAYPQQSHEVARTIPLHQERSHFPTRPNPRATAFGPSHVIHLGSKHVVPYLSQVHRTDSRGVVPHSPQLHRISALVASELQPQAYCPPISGHSFSAPSYSSSSATNYLSSVVNLILDLWRTPEHRWTATSLEEQRCFHTSDGGGSDRR